jgi:hypothetical protein
MNTVKHKSIVLTNPRTGETWLCENYNVRRNIDGVEFVEVRKPDNTRTVWMNLDTLQRVKQPK